MILNTARERRRGCVHQGGRGKEGGTAIQRREGEEQGVANVQTCDPAVVTGLEGVCCSNGAEDSTSTQRIEKGDTRFIEYHRLAGRRALSLEYEAVSKAYSASQQPHLCPLAVKAVQPAPKLSPSPLQPALLPDLPLSLTERGAVANGPLFPRRHSPYQARRCPGSRKGYQRQQRGNGRGGGGHTGGCAASEAGQV